MLHWWKRVFREYFTFHSRERRGVFVLIGVIIFAMFLPSIIQLTSKENSVDFSVFKRQIDSFNTQVSSGDSVNEVPTVYHLDRESKSDGFESAAIQLFKFDPNSATDEDFHQLGLSSRTTKTILNYRDKGGKFFKKEDFKKIYGLNDEEYQRLEPFIVIQSFSSDSNFLVKSNTKSKGSVEKEETRIDINAADSSELVSLPGIGPVLSSRIIKYRNKLGGFYSVDQLTEVYGLKPETVDAIKSKIEANPSEIKKININEVTVDELKLQPYFKPIAIPLVAYREQHGNFKVPTDLTNIDLIDQSLLNKLTPYLEF